MTQLQTTFTVITATALIQIVADLMWTQRSLCRWVGRPSTPHSTLSRQPSAGAPHHLRCPAHRCRIAPHTAALVPAELGGTLLIAEGPASAQAVREGRQLVFRRGPKQFIDLVGSRLWAKIADNVQERLKLLLNVSRAWPNGQRGQLSLCRDTDSKSISQCEGVHNTNARRTQHSLCHTTNCQACWGNLDHLHAQSRNDMHATHIKLDHKGQG